MPALANIYCHGVPSGLTLTGNVYPDGSDIAAATGLTVTEATNRKTTYVLNAGVTGLHLIHLLSGSNVVWVGWTPTNLAITGDFEACATRREALNLDGKVSDVPAAVRDVDNTSPAENSLGADVAAAKGSASSADSKLNTVLTNIAAVPAAVWAVATSTLTATGSIGKLVSDTLTSLAAMIENSSGWRFKTKALEQAPAGGGGGGGEVTSFSAAALNQLQAQTIRVNSVTRSADNIDVHIGALHSEEAGTAWEFTDAAGVYPHDGEWWIEVRDANDTAVGTVEWVSGDIGESTVFRGEMTAEETAKLTASGGKGTFWVLQRLTEGSDPILRWRGTANLYQAQRAA